MEQTSNSSFSKIAGSSLSIISSPISTQPHPQSHNHNNAETNSYYTRVLDTEQFLPESQSIIKEFICSLCSGVFYNPVIDPCGHVFCNHCFTTYLKFNKPICPTTSKPYSTTDHSKISQNAPAYFTQIIGKQKLHCIKRDCDWVNELTKLYDHIRNDCIHVIIKCQYKENGCKYSSNRSDLKSHEANCSFRIYECELCKEKTYYYKKEEHKINCRKERVECPQKCSLPTVSREDLENHIIYNCENTKVNCEFAFFGCKEVLARKNIGQHNITDRKNHIRMIHQGQENLTEQVKALSAKIREGSDVKKQIILNKPLGSQYYYENIYKFRNYDMAIIKEIEALHGHLAENIKYNRKRKEKLKLADEEIEDIIERDENFEDFKTNNEELGFLKKKRGSDKTDDEDIMSVKF